MTNNGFARYLYPIVLFQEDAEVCTLPHSYASNKPCKDLSCWHTLAHHHGIVILWKNNLDEGIST
jgi:hypothetical protein